LHSGIVRNREVDLETLDQVEDELATAVMPLAFTAARTGRAANFAHIEIRQVQVLSGFREALEGAGIDYQFDSLHLRTQVWPMGNSADYVKVNAWRVPTKNLCSPKDFFKPLESEQSIFKRGEFSF
jgi:hypothetical protein